MKVYRLNGLYIRYLSERSCQHCDLSGPRLHNSNHQLEPGNTKTMQFFFSAVLLHLFAVCFAAPVPVPQTPRFCPAQLTLQQNSSPKVTTHELESTLSVLMYSLLNLSPRVNLFHTSHTSQQC